MTEKEKFDVARELIRHEDGLINNRVTWLLVLQGFLFTAFVGGIGLYEKVNCSSGAGIYVTIGLALIPLLGIISCIVALNVMRIAFRQMETVKRWWHEAGHSKDFPPLAGSLGKGWFYFLFSAGRMPFHLIGIWVALLVLLVVGS